MAVLAFRSRGVFIDGWTDEVPVDGYGDEGLPVLLGFRNSGRLLDGEGGALIDGHGNTICFKESPTLLSLDREERIT